MRNYVFYFFIILAWLIGHSLATRAGDITTDKIRVVASFSILGDMVRVLGNDKVDIVTLVGPDSDGHLYRPTPSDGKTITQSDLVITNGLHFEGWITRLIDSANYRGPVVIATDGVHAMNVNGEPDPHAWQSLENARLYANNITRALIQLQPESANDFAQRNQQFAVDTLKLQQTAKQLFNTTPADQRLVVTSHDAFGYFGREYGIQFIAPLGVNTDSEASAGNVAQLIRQIKNQNIGAVFVENITDPRLMEQVARETDAHIGGSLYSDALSSVSGPASTYLEMMRHNITLISTALGASTDMTTKDKATN